MDLIGQHVKVKLKWGMEYYGTLHSADAYMNVQLHHCDEYIEQQLAGHLGTVLIRCNNVLYIVVAEPPDSNNNKTDDTPIEKEETASNMVMAMATD
jgi:small nuclear ribonucleoprotein F